MRLIFKQWLFSWFDSYDIYDEAGNTVFTVEGQLSWGHCLKIFASDGAELGTVKEKVLTLLPKFELYLGDRYIGSVKKRFTLFRNVYDIDCRGWTVNGDVFGLHRNIFVGRYCCDGFEGALSPYGYIRHRCKQCFRRALRFDADACDRCGKMFGERMNTRCPPRYGIKNRYSRSCTDFCFIISCQRSSL